MYGDLVWDLVEITEELPFGEDASGRAAVKKDTFPVYALALCLVEIKLISIIENLSHQVFPQVLAYFCLTLS